MKELARPLPLRPSGYEGQVRGLASRPARRLGLRPPQADFGEGGSFNAGGAQSVRFARLPVAIAPGDCGQGYFQTDTALAKEITPKALFLLPSFG